LPRASTRSPSRSSAHAPARSSSRSAPRLRRLLRLLVVALAAFYGAVVVSLVYLRFLRPMTTMVQAQRRVESWFTRGDYTKRMTWVAASSLPRHVPRAVVAAEDTRFFRHHGFDFEEVAAARRAAGREVGSVRGASTLTQQLVKNLYFTTHRSYVRKALELTITPLAELILGKQRILELYLNVVEWGPGVYGIEAAARHHYRVPAARLTRDRAARLAAILPAPRRRKPARMGRYAGIIQARMGAMGW
jgi:monofunctional biosynthetic peptidoglycan transglycosylase